MSDLLVVDAVSAGYGGVEIIHEISIAIDRGELVTIIGPNGAGKSTLLKAIFGAIVPVTSPSMGTTSRGCRRREWCGWARPSSRRPTTCFRR